MRSNRVLLLSVLVLTSVLGGAVAAIPAQANPGTQLVFDAAGKPAGSVTAGSTFTLIVNVEDGTAAIDTTSSAPVSLSISGGAAIGNYSGPVDAVSGVATFPNVWVGHAGTGYTITASSPGLTDGLSNSFDVTAGAASTIAFTDDPPASVPSGQQFGATVQVLDAGSNPVAGSNVTVALQGGNASAQLSGTLTQATDANGNATFSDLTVDLAGTGYTLVASDPDLTPTATSGSFDVTTGSASTIAFTDEPPGSVKSGQQFGATVQVLDAASNPVSGSDVTLSLQGGNASAHLGGTLTEATDSDGNATFSDLTVDLVDTGYTLVASDTDLGSTTATSDPFNVTTGAASSIAFTQGPTPAAPKSEQQFSVVVQVLDGGSNPVSGSDVTLSLQGGNASAHLGGTLTQTTDSGGDATFSNLTVDLADTGYQLVASDPDLGSTTATSTAFNVTAGSVAKIVVTVVPTSAVVGETMTPIFAEAQDAAGNHVDGTGHATLSFAENPGGGALVPEASTQKFPSPNTGLWRFADLSITKGGAPFKVKVTAMGLTSAPSASFTVMGKPTLSIATNHSVISAGVKVTVTVHLLSHAGSQCSVAPTLNYVYSSDKSMVLLGTPTWNKTGCVGTLTVPRSRNGHFQAQFAGDSVNLAAPDSKQILLQVHAVVSDGLAGGYGFHSGYRLYHYHSSCPGSHSLCPTIHATVMPPKISKRVNFALQAFQHGRWIGIATTHATSNSSGMATVIWIYGNASVKGIPLRTRASYGPDLDNLIGYGPWRYFKVTS